MRLHISCESGSLHFEYDPDEAEEVDETDLEAMKWSFDDLDSAETITRDKCTVTDCVVHESHVGTPEGDTLTWLSEGDSDEIFTVLTMEDGTVQVQSITGDFGLVGSIL